ncbi:MAG: bifunctional diguanylate cyclase/phosphodiesterase [Pseudomonadota bacterium]
MESILRTVIESANIRCLFQPIVNARSRRVLGYEASARGPSNNPLHSPVALFAEARAAGLCAQLDRVFLACACKQRHELGLIGRLHINLSTAGLLALANDLATLEQLLVDCTMSPTALVFELTESGIAQQRDEIRDAMHRCRKRGISFTIDNLGSGSAGLKAWSELAPEFVKIDGYFVGDVHKDPIKQGFVRAIVDMARATRSEVIAEGVEIGEDADALISAGVRSLQGFYTGRASEQPADPASATSIMPGLDQMMHLNKASGTARALAFEQTPISADVLVSSVTDIFYCEPELEAIPVVDGDHAVGIVDRSAFLDLMSMPLRHELHAKKPIRDLMHDTPLIVEADARLEQVSRIVTSGDKTRLNEQFIIVDNGRYLGMARVIDLLREITVEQVKVARYSNPLTLLPGNVPIYDWINAAVGKQSPFVLCHVDVDNFKPFNDYYGYAKGDEALIMMAKILTRSSCPNVDFVGHVGGDDFVLVFQSEDWKARLQCCFEEVEELRNELYPQEDLERGFIVASDRTGSERSFPLLSISVAALVCAGDTALSAEALIHRLAPIKSRAKRTIGNSLEIVGCSYDNDIDERDERRHAMNQAASHRG